MAICAGVTISNSPARRNRATAARDVFEAPRDRFAKRGHTENLEGKPQLQRAEAAGELDAVVARSLRPSPVRVAEVGGQDAEGVAQQARSRTSTQPVSMGWNSHFAGRV